MSDKVEEVVDRVFLGCALAIVLLMALIWGSVGAELFKSREVVESPVSAVATDKGDNSLSGLQDLTINIEGDVIFGGK